MRRMCIPRVVGKTSRQVFLVTLCFCLSLLGCDNACFIFVSNPGGGTIAAGSTGCSLNNSSGTVRVRLTSSVKPAAGNWPASIQHIFVTLRSIEANPSATSDEDSPDWQELAPKLATQPIQLDLLEWSGDSCEPSGFGNVTVPADAYRQIRMRLTVSQPGSSEPVPQENGCGSVGFNCVVTADGRIRPLVLDSQSLEVRIPPDHIAGGFFRVLPEAAGNLAIEFHPDALLVFPEGEALRLVPVFTVEPEASCESNPSLNP